MLNPKEIKLNRVLHGKNQDVLKDFPDSFFDSVVTDPPYELNFCNKEWDATGVAYSKEMWQEVLRVAKPGATLFCFGGTRTYHRVACAIEDAGWIIKDSLMWIYGSGFPKSLDICKQIDKESGKADERGYIETTGGLHGGTGTTVGCFTGRQLSPDPVSDLAKQWQGMGTALKPSFEPIILAMKPLEKGLTYAQNARKHGVAGLNIDAGRIGSDKLKINNYLDHQVGITNLNGQSKASSEYRSKITRGRWPANVILSHSPDCVQVGIKQVGSGEYHKHVVKDAKSSWKNASQNINTTAYGQETIDVYACVPDCPIRIMDSQSGKLKSGDNCTRTKEGYFGEHGGLGKAGDVQITYGDSGGASRFFYCAKASRSERESGLKDFVPCVKCGEIGTEQHTSNGVKENCIHNNHPTVKPTAIMEYLCKLIKMPEQQSSGGIMQSQIILDPFCGSGSTLLAADKVGIKYIGIDMGIDNVLIASSRSIDTPPDDCLPENELKLKDIDPIEAASNAEQLSSADFEDLLI